MFNIADTFESKEKVLIMNYHALANNYKLLYSDYNDMKNYNFFHCKDSNNKNIVLFFQEYITEDHIKSIIKQKFVSKLSD